MIKLAVVTGMILLVGLMTGCGVEQGDTKAGEKGQVEAVSSDKTEAITPHKGVNQEPVPLVVERVGEKEVNVEMTAQITDIEIAENHFYKAWTFNGQAPGPVVIVKEGDLINFTLKNTDPSIPHSMDFHAVHTAPSKNFADIMPDEQGTFRYTASKPGVFMYHCGTKPVLSHIANGMHGTIIVKPENGYPNDGGIDREFVILQNEWYKYNDLEDFASGEPSHVAFSTKSLDDNGRNTNGDTFTLKKEPLIANVGDRIRMYVNNVGPNEMSSFHVVGTIFDDVYIDGNPFNHMQGLQTVLLPASGGAIVEFTVKEAGDYPIVTHQFNHAEKGAVAILRVDGPDDK
ncbi:multicopper oxidase domain-containing protein [Thalassobacillus pellis]|uniref:multicopper oxidase domain-containing protein n=1 Tax=Thalassobacillus pellis TaxID=748008 RepID=UPI00195F3538|nr:multicopper oxidase domain-containing protein [Thalassobacillus pellis]MBM7551397.1 nitrite reductase (NO-forming) [Thalassobacillus pellis]